MKMISLVIACFNGDRWVGRALESVYAQTLDKGLWETVFIDDGSRDRTAGIAGAYERHPNFRYYRNDANSGLPSACNRGIEESRGDYIVRLDADDYLEPVALERLAGAARQGEPDLVYSDRVREDRDGNVLERTSLERFDIYGLIACGVLMKRDILKSIGGYRDFGWEEYDLYIRYLEAGGRDIRYVAEPLYHYVSHGGNMTADVNWNEAAWRELVKEWEATGSGGTARLRWTSPDFYAKGRASMSDRTLIIAEIGENHLGDMDLAARMVREAAAAGADIVKFQSYGPDTFRKDDPEYDWFCRVSLSDEAHRLLKDEAERCGVGFMSAPFSLERARFLCEDLRTGMVKVASGKMADLKLLSYLNENCEEVFLSTGMADLEEIRSSLAALKKVRVSLLHCVTQYPLEDADANLAAIVTLRNEFPGLRIGYSDHTIGILAPLVAVALGAGVIEKHFTMDKKAEGTDHILSATPEELARMVTDIRKAELLLGSGEKIPRRSEAEIRDFVRGRFLG